MNARNRRSLSFQSLEGRLPFAADLSLQFVNGDLSITGDGDAETLVVQEFKLVGGREVLAISGQNGTTINGQATLTLLSNNVRNVSINLNGGNDRLTIRGLDSDLAGGDLEVRTGGGDDVLILENVNFGDDISLDTESDDDEVSLTNVFAGDLLSIDLDNGNDLLALIDTLAADTFIQAGNGDDFVDLNNADSVDQLFVDMNDGDDTLNLNKVNAGRFDLNGGDDDDTLNVRVGVVNQFNLDGIRAQQGARNFETINQTF